MIRGYEEIKLRNVVLFRKRADAILKRLRGVFVFFFSASTASPSSAGVVVDAHRRGRRQDVHVAELAVRVLRPHARPENTIGMFWISLLCRRDRP